MASKKKIISVEYSAETVKRIEDIKKVLGCDASTVVRGLVNLSLKGFRGAPKDMLEVSRLGSYLTVKFE